MALTTAQIREELTALRQKKNEVDRKIAALESFLGQETANGKHVTTAGVSARGGVDIRPTIMAIFDENVNTPLRLKDLVDMVAARHQDVPYAIIEKKMVHAKRTILKSFAYGMYQLAKFKAPPQVEVGASVPVIP